MIYRRRPLAPLEKCYAVSTLPVAGKTHFLFASEIPRPALAFDGQTLEPEEISIMGGGTMSMVPLPNSQDFLAIENFFPPSPPPTANWSGSAGGRGRGTRKIFSLCPTFTALAFYPSLGDMR